MHQINNQFLRSHYAKQERKIIRKSGNIIGGIILAALLFIDIISEIIGEVIIAFSEYYIIDYTLTSYALQIALSAMLFVPPFFIMANVQGFRVRDLFVRKKVPFLTNTSIILSGFMLCLAINIVTNYWVQFLESLGMNTQYSGLPEPATIYETIIWIFTISVMPAIVEEFAFRVVVLGSLRRFSDSFAIFASAALFGLVHGTNALGGADPGSSILQIFTSMGIGFVLGAMYLRSGNLWPGIITHFLFDVLAIAMSSGVSDNGIITEGISAGSWVNLAFCIAAAIIAVILFRKEEEISGTIRVWKSKWKVEA